jgi:hypothetical protein
LHIPASSFTSSHACCCLNACMPAWSCTCHVDWWAQEAGGGGEGQVHRAVGGEPRHDTARTRRAPNLRGADGMVSLVSWYRAWDSATMQVIQFITN